MPLLRLPSELWGSDQTLITGCKCSLPVASLQGHYAEAEPLYKRALRIAGAQEGEIESLGIYRYYYLIGKSNVFYLHHYSIRDFFLAILLSCNRLLQNSRRGFAWREYIFAKGWDHG